MAVYFIEAVGPPAIKIGYGENPKARLQMCQTGSPVRLALAAVDEAGDYLTEWELLHRFRADRMHGEWFVASSALREVVDAVQAAGLVPERWCMPDPCRYWPLFDDVRSRFGMTRGDYAVACNTTAPMSNEARGIPGQHVPRLAFWLRERGLISAYTDLFDPHFMRVVPARVR